MYACGGEIYTYTHYKLQTLVITWYSHVVTHFMILHRKANSGAGLSGLDSELVSMVILEQVTLVIRSLRTPCLLPDSILTGKIDTISQTQIR